MDPPAQLAKTLHEEKINYRLLSDRYLDAAQALGIAYHMDDKTRRAIEAYGVELEETSEQPNLLLPVPTVFLVNPKGVIRYEYVNPDYRERIDPDVLLAAAKALAPKMKG
jgi:peroxiredoxin